ncbi:MAG TPA: sigma-70 family RNA polymerase sigma factor [Gemmatimonadaceae bacterium]|jgi:RNA polymerase sigma factor (sigma-70 family)
MRAEHVEDGGRDLTAWQELVPLVYDELLAIARRQLRCERDSHTLSTAGLVHETFLRLVNQRGVRWQDRSQVFAIAARVMRRVLIDYARQHRAAKRGGTAQTISIERAEKAFTSEPGVGGAIWDSAATDRAELLVALDDALSRLAVVDERMAQVVECRFFGDLSEEETAAALGVTARTVRRDWVKAKAWLRRALEL